VQLPNWLKIAWWILLTGAVTYFLWRRYPDLVAGRAVPADIVAFVIWMALLLAPLFKEVSLLGITLKQEVDELKKFVSSQVAEVRADLKNVVDVRTNITIPAPAPDAQLPELERRIKGYLSEALATHFPVKREVPGAKLSVEVEENVTLLFNTRYALEKELRRIARARELIVFQRRAIPIFQITRALLDACLIDQTLEHAIREVYAVCSPAVHGEPVTEAQVKFVADVGPDLVSSLKAIV